MKLPHRRQFLHLAAGAASLPVVSRIARAQAYPMRPITMIVPYPAVALIDATARVLADRMRRSLGQPINIENISGAGGNIGTGRSARANPDGYTVEIGNNGTHVQNGAFYSLPYDVLNDFAPISPLGTFPSVFYARKTMPGNDLYELIAWLRANPNKASAGIYSAGGRLTAAIFQKETGTKFALVSYRGGPPTVQDLAAGQIDLFLAGTTIDLPLMRAGSIKAYAVSSGARVALAPDIPTYAEMGLSAMSSTGWFGLFAPKRTPREIITKLNAAAVEALADPAVRARLIDFGLDILPRERHTPDALAAMQKADAEKFWPLIKEFGIMGE